MYVNPTLESFQSFFKAVFSSHLVLTLFTCLGAVGLRTHYRGLSSGTYSWPPLSPVVTLCRCQDPRALSVTELCEPQQSPQAARRVKGVKNLPVLLSKWIPFRVSQGILHFLAW